MQNLIKILHQALRFYENYEVYRKAYNFVSHLKECVSKWTCGDEDGKASRGGSH